MAALEKEVTQLIKGWQRGDPEASAALFETLLPELRKIAGCCFRGERSGHTLQPTALVNEAFLRLSASNVAEWQNRGHFLAVAARIMRRCLIDYARGRPEVRFLPLEGLPEAALGNRTNLDLAIAVDALLDELETESERQREIVELKFVLGLTDAEAAEALGITLHTAQREWYRARKWLFARLYAGAWTAEPITTSG